MQTLTGAESTSLVIARGSCIASAEELDVPIKLYCNGDGEWMVPIGSCSCKAGYEPDKANVCQGERVCVFVCLCVCVSLLGVRLFVSFLFLLFSYKVPARSLSWHL